MTRIEEVLRELSDLRDFQIKLERRHNPAAKRENESVAEEEPDYNRKKTTASLPISSNPRPRGNEGSSRDEGGG